MMMLGVDIRVNILLIFFVFPFDAKGDFLRSSMISSVPACFVTNSSSLKNSTNKTIKGLWPLRLWLANTTASVANTKPSSIFIPHFIWRVTGSPGSDQQIESSSYPRWKLNQTLGYTMPQSQACYWGLPSIRFTDPAFGSPGSFVYWRGNAWAPLAMLTYWALDHEAYRSVNSVQISRKGMSYFCITLPIRISH